MINYRVEDLPALVTVLRDEGCNVLDKVDESEIRHLCLGDRSPRQQGRALAAAGWQVIAGTRRRCGRSATESGKRPSR